MSEENAAPPLHPINRPIPTALCFDVEDIVAPECDEVARWMAEILREYKLTGSFMVMGESARLWEQRGRRDVIEALKQHHLAFHSTWHSVHPTTTEICLDKDFRQGMEALWQWDREGWEATERILGQPLLGWARTGNSWSPSVMGLMGRMGRAYAYSQVRLPGHNICWYAGCLGFYFDGFFSNFDNALHDDTLFTPHLVRVQRQLDVYLKEERRGAEWLNFFMCHPTKTISNAFWDIVNFAKGANPPRADWQPAPPRDPALIPTMQANFRRLCEYLQSEERLEIVGWGDLIRRFDGQRAFATHGELQDIARRIVRERQVLFTDFFTAGEILLLLCQATVSPQLHYVRPTVYGPLTRPPVSPAEPLEATAVKEAAAFVLEAAATGYLPASVDVAGRAVGVGTYFVALAEALLGQTQVSGPAEAFYPAVAEGIAQHVAATLPDWLVHPDNMNLDNLLEQTRLQCWTLKPAWPREALVS